MWKKIRNYLCAIGVHKWEYFDGLDTALKPFWYCANCEHAVDVEERYNVERKD